MGLCPTLQRRQQLPIFDQLPYTRYRLRHRCYEVPVFPIQHLLGLSVVQQWIDLCDRRNAEARRLCNAAGKAFAKAEKSLNVEAGENFREKPIVRGFREVHES